MKFDEEYTKYWTSAVDKSIDGTKIASLNEVNYFLKDLNISDDNSILDLGCSYGRMSDVLSNYSNKIYGAEPDDYAVGEARNMKYADVKKGSAEKIPYDDNFFDLVFCWAVMDVVDHLRASYNKATLALQMPFAHEFDMFQQVEEIPLVINRPTESRQQIL